MAEENSSSKRKATAVAAVALAAALLVGGGTYAYLQDESDLVTNSFEANTVGVDLTETTGSDYNIVPGTTEGKDPQVTVSSTLFENVDEDTDEDTVILYAYVKVTDETQGLVDYEIDSDNWTQLGGEDSNIYYHAVTYAEYLAAQEAGTDLSYYVLAGNQVSYSADIENSDMVDANGNLLEGLTLSFTAYVSQADPFSDAVEAYYGTSNTVETEEELAAALETANEADTATTIVVTSDITTSTTLTVSSSATVTLALAGNTVTNDTDDTILVEDGATVVVEDGVVDATDNGEAALYNAGGTVTLSNVTLTRSEEAGTTSSNGNTYYVIVNEGTMTIEAGTTVEADGYYSSLIHNGWYYEEDNESEEEAVLTINGGSFIGGKYIKNASYGVLTINDGYFYNENQPNLLNWHTVTINGGTFVNTTYFNLWNYYSSESYNSASMTVTGGTFSHPTSQYGIINQDASDGYGTGTVSVSGGTWNTKYVCYPTSGYIEDGYELQENSDGSYTVVSTESES